MTINRTTRTPALLFAFLLLAACDGEDLTVPSFDDPSREDITSAPTRAAIQALAQGLLAGQRGLTSGWVTTPGIWGREGYNLRPEEPRTITNALIDPIQGSGAFWGGPYTQIQNAFVMLGAVDRAEGLEEAEKEAIKGFTKTLMAEAYFHVMIMHPGLKAPLDVDRDPGGELAPLESEEAVYQHVFSLFDEASGHLSAGGNAFPFSFPGGFSGFNTPTTFLEVNRALKVRALKYRGQWSDVLSTLPGTFIDPDGPLDRGAYHNYSTISGDAVNTFFTQAGTNLFAHPRLLRDAQLRPDGSPDLRAQEKLEAVEPFTLAGITASEKFLVYDGLDAPLPWIRNEELVLIRAEANLALGNRATALEDVNRIRTGSGGLDPLPADWDGDLLRELLYNKLYSLMWEGGFHYLDMRQYGLLDELPRALPTHVVYPGYPYPDDECLARGMESDPGCQPVFGS